MGWGVVHSVSLPMNVCGRQKWRGRGTADTPQGTPPPDGAHVAGLRRPPSCFCILYCFLIPTIREIRRTWGRRFAVNVPATAFCTTWFLCVIR